MPVHGAGKSSVPQKTGITILSFVPLQRKTAVSLTNQGCKGCQNEAKPQAKAPDCRYQRQKRIPRRKPANSPRIRLRRILGVWHKAVAQEMAFSMPKRSSVPQKHGIGGPGGLPWSPQGRGEGLRERGKLRVEKVGFPSPFCLTTLQKVEFALLFQKPIQDPSTRLRLGRDDRLCPPKLCAQQKAPCSVKSSVPVHGTGKSSVHATIPEKGARTSQKQRKTSNRPIPSGSGPVNCFVIYCISSLSRSRYGPQTLKRPRQNNLFLPEYPY